MPATKVPEIEEERKIQITYKWDKRRTGKRKVSVVYVGKRGTGGRRGSRPKMMFFRKEGGWGFSRREY